MTLRATSGAVAPALGFTPRIEVGDALARHWLAQATLRLRREVAWLWHERGTLHGLGGGGALPPMIDPLHEALDLNRYDSDRAAFFVTDPAARYLTDRIAALPLPQGRPVRGGFGWLATELALTSADCLVLALAVGGAVDSARGAVIAACLNAPEARDPTLALAQRLWEAPDQVLPLLDPAHPLVETGILAAASGWDAPLAVAPVVARQLLFPEAPPPAALVAVLPPSPPPAGDAVALAAARLRTRNQTHATLVPLVGPEEGPFASTAAGIAAAADLPLLAARGAGEAGPLMVTVWLRGAAMLLPIGRLTGPEGRVQLPVPGVPAVVFVAMTGADRISALPRRETLAKVDLPALDHAGRLEAWRRALPEVWAADEGKALLAECTRRFGFEEAAIGRIAAALRALDRTIDRNLLFAACRSDLDLGDLAQPVRPRFGLDELMLPARQAGQIRALIRALESLGTVHSDWHLGRAWNDSGLSVLFTGPPGTGKTMAAEAIAAEVGMPLYRIDLSQVVNKYIGETEKNLARLFDAADSGDAILFFDEADALFGKRTEVKDAHDRYANLEVSYLLERMERFRGMAILASNRRKDLDEAFLRRLRTIVTFPLPEAAERLRIWLAVMPEGVDCHALDLAFLAERLPLSGGHIRSAVFNACLQSVRPGEPPRLEMAEVVRAVKDEFDKLGRTVSLDQFGAYAGEVRDEP
ncbi:MAG: ATP-binding protein [Rhodobacter sp.]|jgi:hypothetical protein|nr:ATP-binding protein [Rhodobacter sp.]